MYNETITFYAKTPPNRGVLEKFDIEFWEENRSCGDDLKVYIKIDDGKISDRSFEGDTAIMTTACASIFGESILGLPIEEVFSFNYSSIVEMIGMEVSPRRKQASVLGVLTTRNAIHQYLGDGKRDRFEDLF